MRFYEEFSDADHPRLGGKFIPAGEEDDEEEEGGDEGGGEEEQDECSECDEDMEVGAGGGGVPSAGSATNDEFAFESGGMMRDPFDTNLSFGQLCEKGYWKAIKKGAVRGATTGAMAGAVGGYGYGAGTAMAGAKHMDKHHPYKTNASFKRGLNWGVGHAARGLAAGAGAGAVLGGVSGGLSGAVSHWAKRHAPRKEGVGDQIHEKGAIRRAVHKVGDFVSKGPRSYGGAAAWGAGTAAATAALKVAGNKDYTPGQKKFMVGGSALLGAGAGAAARYYGKKVRKSRSANKASIAQYLHNRNWGTYDSVEDSHPLILEGPRWNKFKAKARKVNKFVSKHPVGTGMALGTVGGAAGLGSLTRSWKGAAAGALIGAGHGIVRGGIKGMELAYQRDKERQRRQRRHR